MNVTRKVQTTLHCDMGECSAQRTFHTSSYLSDANAMALARREGWRRDKLSRVVCPVHPKLKGARRG